MNRQNNLFLVTKVLGNLVLICRYITLAFLMMHFGSFCIVFHVFASISDFFFCFWLGDSENSYTFAVVGAVLSF